MTEIDLNRILDQATQPPPCPNDKLVANMLQHMEKEVQPTSAKLALGKHLLVFGSMAAAFIVALGITATFLDSNNFGTKSGQIVVTNDAGFENLTVESTTDEYADDFANQLIGYEDISVIVPLNDL
jgi:hypothetical protein